MSKFHICLLEDKSIFIDVRCETREEAENFVYVLEKLKFFLRWTKHTLAEANLEDFT
jgi:hypothetical protein